MLKSQSDEWQALQFLWSAVSPAEDASPEEVERFLRKLICARRHLNRAIWYWRDLLQKGGNDA